MSDEKPCNVYAVKFKSNRGICISKFLFGCSPLCMCVRVKEKERKKRNKGNCVRPCVLVIVPSSIYLLSETNS